MINTSELDKIKLKKDLERIGGMVVDIKGPPTPIQDEEKYNIENPLFMQVYREKQVGLLSKENPLFQVY